MAVDYTKYAGWTRGEMIRTIETLVQRQTTMLNAIARLEANRAQPFDAVVIDTYADILKTINGAATSTEPPTGSHETWIETGPVRFPWEK